MTEQDLVDVSLPAPQFTPSPPSDEGSGLARFEHRVEAAYHAQRYDNDIQARSVALSTATDFRNKDILRETGATLENPLEGGYKAEALERVAKSGQPAFLPDVQSQIYQEKLDALASQYPDKADAIGASRPILQDAKRMANYWADRAARGEPGLSATANFVGGLIGGGAGFLRSPINATLMLIGGGELKAASLVGKMAEGFVREGLVNAGLQAVAEPGVQSWRAERGREHGVVPALEDVAVAGLFGGGFGAGAQAVKAGAQAVKARFLSAVPEKALADAATTPLAEHAPQLRAAAKAVDADASILADAPREAGGVDMALSQAIRHGEGLDDALPELMTGRASDHDARDVLALEEPGATESPNAATIERKAREISPKPFARADELDNRIAGARAEIARAAEEAAGGGEAGQLQTRLAGLQRDLDAITGKRRSSPRAQALRQEIADLTAQSAALLEASQARAADRMQTLRMTLNDAQNERALLGPKLHYVRNHAAGMLGLRMADLPVKDATVTAERLRRAPPLIWSALSSEAPDLKAAGRLASLGDAAFAEVRDGAVAVDVALATAARVTDEAEQLAVMRGAQAQQPRGAAAAAAAVSLEMETRATPKAQAALLGASEAHAQVPASRFSRENAAAASAQIEELQAALAEKPEPAQTVKPKRSVTRQFMSLFEAIASQGGLEPNAELAAIFDGNPFVPGFGRIVRSGGNNLDEALRLAKDFGYLSDPAEAQGAGALTLSTNDLLDLLRQEAHGEKVFSEADRAEMANREAARAAKDFQRAHKKAMQSLSKEPALKPREGWTPDEKILSIAATRMVEDPGLTPLQAFDRAAVDYERELWAQSEQFPEVQQVRHDETGDLPGWDIPGEAGDASSGGRETARAGQGAPGEGRGNGEARQEPRNDGGDNRAPGQELLTEPGAEGKPQTLIPGVAPVTEKQRLELAAAKPLRGKAADMPAGGLFDEGARAQADLLDLVPRDDGKPLPIEDVLKERPREELLSLLVKDCEL